MRKFKIIEHTADIGIIAFGKDLPQLFSNAAFGMFSLITDLNKITQKDKLEISTLAKDREELMIYWLNDLLWNYSVNKIIPSEFEILKMDDCNLDARVIGEKYDEKKHNIEMEVKAATYHQLKIEKKTNWQVQIIFDV